MVHTFNICHCHSDLSIVLVISSSRSDMLHQNPEQKSAVNKRIMSTNRIPTWIVQNDGSFASCVVTLPPNTSFHCESDAVVSMSQSIDVVGKMSGGILAGK